MRNKILLSVAILASLTMGTKRAEAQGMAVNTSGAAANTSSMLDVTSTTKGMLIPRMTAAQKLAISSPATGLMIFQTDGTSGFYYYDGAAWTTMGGGGSKAFVITGFEHTLPGTGNGPFFGGLASFQSSSATAAGAFPFPIAKACTLDIFRVTPVGDMIYVSGAINSETGTIYKNGVATTSTVTFSVPNATTVGQILPDQTDNTHTVICAAGDLITVQWTQTNGLNGAIAKAMITLHFTE